MSERAQAQPPPPRSSREAPAGIGDQHAAAFAPSKGDYAGQSISDVPGWWFVTLFGPFVIAKYLGWLFLLGLVALAGFIILLALGIRKVTRPQNRPMSWALAILVTQVVWAVVVGVLLPGGLRAEAPFLALQVAGTVWLWLRPGWTVVALLSVLQAYFFSDRLLAVQSMPSTALPGFTLVVLVQALAIALMLTAVPRVLRAAPDNASPAPEVASVPGASSDS